MLIIGSNVSVDGAFLWLDEIVIAFVLLLLFFVVFFLVLLLVFFIFFLVSLGLFVVIILESIIDLGQNIGLKTVQILLGNQVLGLLRIQRLWHWHGAQLCLSSNKVRSSEGLLEVSDLLLQYAVLTLQLRVLFLQLISLRNYSLEELRLLVKLLL